MKALLAQYCGYRTAKAVQWRNENPTFGIQPLPGGDKDLASTSSVQILDNSVQFSSILFHKHFGHTRRILEKLTDQY